MREHLRDFPVVIQLPVVWGEMDAYGHVNNIIYFRYFESARMAYFEKIGFAETREQTGVGPILASTSCRFKRALTYPDTIHVGTRVRHMGEDRFTMEYRVVSEAHQAVAAEGEGLIVSYDYRSNVKAPLPKSVREGIETLEGKAF